MEKLINSHVYQDVDFGRKEIRLLELLPGVRSDLVCVKLLHVSLDAQPHYDALSYIWGDTTPTRSIRVEEDDGFQVTANLESALRDLRHTDRSIILWIDAICINQRNVRERNQQVQLMRYIYEGASVVRAWLNLEIDPGCPAFVRFAQFDENTSPEELGNDREFWDPVASVSENPYWNRVWMQQEVTHAQNFVIHCRRNILSTSSFLHYERLMHTTSFRNQTEMEINYNVVPNLLSRRFPPSDDGLLPRHYSMKTRFYGTIVEALSRCRSLEATDPRDRVYGVLSLVKGLSDRDVIINYELSVCEVYCNVVKFALRQTKSLSFLTNATLVDRNPALCLPTWLPDWSFTLKDPSVMSLDSTLEEAATSIVTDSPQILECQRILNVHGFCIGRVLWVSADAQNDASNMIERLREWDNLVQAATQINLNSKSADARSGIRQRSQLGKVKTKLRSILGLGKHTMAAERSTDWKALLRTILFSVDPVEEQIRENCISLLEAVVLDIIAKWDHHLSTALMWQEPHKTFWRNLVMSWLLAARSQRLFLTSTAVFGMASKAIRPGDEIWFLHRCPMPMVLRRENDHFLVVGPARLDSKKLGELTRNWVATARKGVHSEEYKMESIFLH